MTQYTISPEQVSRIFKLSTDLLEKPADETLPDKAESQANLQAAYSFVFDLKPIDLQTLSSDESKLYVIKVPIAIEGEWHHPSYGMVSFDSEKFTQMIENNQGKETGFEPPLFLGHPRGDLETVEGAPAEGYLLKLYTEDYNGKQVLYGEFELVDPNTYMSVKQGKFRYASAEFVDNALSKLSGEEIGCLFLGVALTNRPHLTGLPRVQALSDAFTISDCTDRPETFRVELGENQTQNLSNLLSSNSNMSDPIIDPASTSIPESVSTSPSPGSVANQGMDTKALADLVIQLTTQVQSAQAEAAEAKRAAALASERSQKIELASQVASLNALCLSQETKDSFRDMFESPEVSDTVKSDLLVKLSRLSSENEIKLTTQVISSDVADVSGVSDQPAPETPVKKLSNTSGYAALLQKEKDRLTNSNQGAY